MSLYFRYVWTPLEFQLLCNSEGHFTPPPHLLQQEIPGVNADADIPRLFKAMDGIVKLMKVSMSPSNSVFDPRTCQDHATWPLRSLNSPDCHPLQYLIVISITLNTL